MGKTSYKNTRELIQTLSENIDRLNSGKLNVDELDALVQSSRDLYELLVVLRYKAFDKGLGATQAHPAEAVVETPKITQEEKKEKPAEEPLFDFTAMSEPEPKETAKPAEEENGFDFTLDEAAAESEKESAKPSKEKEEIKHTNTKAPEPEEEPVKQAPFATSQALKSEADDEEEDDNNSLNDLFKNEEDLSLRKKFQNTPISDIKTHISIAKKFEYINSLFEGDSTAYNEAIEVLNDGSDAAEARSKLDDYSKQYNWNLEDKSIIKFIELVERRYQ